MTETGFNPAEAEEWFRRLPLLLFDLIQYYGFNPAEAEEWFRSEISCLCDGKH